MSIWAAVEAHLGGADGITVHLREDRRHIQDEDVRRLRTHTQIKLNFEMAATKEMVAIAGAGKPSMSEFAHLRNIENDPSTSRFLRVVTLLKYASTKFGSPTP